MHYQVPGNIAGETGYYSGFMPISLCLQHCYLREHTVHVEILIKINAAFYFSPLVSKSIFFYERSRKGKLAEKKSVCFG